MDTSLELFFDSLKTENDLAALVTSPGREEDLHLEFKRKMDARNSTLSDGDRGSFSIALSAFANADGGVLIFGVGTKRTRDGIDHASELNPIADIQQFCRRLSDLALNTTQPVIEDIRTEVILSDANNNEGYVKCFIPQSYRPPHRAMHGREKGGSNHYWIRNSRGTRLMEHFELEDIFGRRLRPVLTLRVDTEPSNNDPLTVELTFKLLNEGRGIAKHIGIHSRLFSCTLQQVSHPLLNISHMNKGEQRIQFDGGQAVMHPNGLWTMIGKASIRRESLQQPIVVQSQIYAENMRLKEDIRALLA